MKRRKELTIYCVMVLVILFGIFCGASRLYYGKLVFPEIGNSNKENWETEELQTVSKDFQLLEDGSFISTSPDPWFTIEEGFEVKTIIIDVESISNKGNSQVFYYSDRKELSSENSSFFVLKEGINYLQIPRGKYNKFRLDLVENEGISIKIKSITTFGSRTFSSAFLVTVLLLGILGARVLYFYMFKKPSAILQRWLTMVVTKMNQLFCGNSRKLKSFCFTFVIYLITFGVMLGTHYSKDSFTYLNHTTSSYFGNLGNGRYGNYLFNVICDKLSINIVESQRIFILFLMLALTISTELLYELYAEKVEKQEHKILIKLALITVFANFFMVDWFLFIEFDFSWACSILLVTWATCLLKKGFTWLRAAEILLITMISVSFYQAVLGFFVFFALIYIYICNKGKMSMKSFFQSTFIMFCAGISGLINIVSIKILQYMGIVTATDRTGNVGIEQILQNLRSIYNAADTYLRNAYGLFPENWLIVGLIVLYALICYYLVKNHYKIRDAIYLILLIVCCRFILYLPHIVASTVWMAPRSIASYWTILALPALALVVLDVEGVKRQLAIIVMCVLLVANIRSASDIAINIIASCRIDQELMTHVFEKICEYENSTGTTIDTISVGFDDNPTWAYSCIKYQVYDYSQRLFTTPRESVECLNYMYDKNYIYEEMDRDTMQYYFGKTDWNSWNLDEQMHFENNKLFMVVY